MTVRPEIAEPRETDAYLKRYCQLAQEVEIHQVSAIDKKINPYAGQRCPPEIIRHAVWRYFRFTLSFRKVEEILANRGIIVSDETVQQSTFTFGQTYGYNLRRRQPKCGDTWHRGEVVRTMYGTPHSLWRAVGQDGATLDILGQSRHDRTAATRCFRKLLKGLCSVPCVIITDTLKRDEAATRDILPGGEYRQHQRGTNQAELLYHPTRQKEPQNLHPLIVNHRQ